ncbi:Nucleic acid-binding, OB-fold [Sesbania bispinosa]|nr:Nucleic acid-binding, OB-fold [Sesbania bispinosa]
MAKIECVLFENYLDDLNAFLASGNTTNVVVVVQHAKVKSFKGKVSLQNVLHATMLIFNLDFDKAVELRKRLEENTEFVSQPLSQIAEAPKISIEEEFLTHTIMKTIKELKDSKEECCCIVLAMIKHLIDGEEWWYKACRCDTCSDLLESIVQPTDKHFPAEISALVDKTFLFKVENKIVSNSRFETSYKDLFSQFCDAVNDDENNALLSGTADGVGLTMNSNCITPCKRNSDDCTDDPIVAAASMKMKKIIKQEKD